MSNPSPKDVGFLRSTDPALIQFQANMDKMADRLAKALPSLIPVERFLSVTLTAAQRQPELFECHPLSLYGSIIQAAQLGLVPDGVLGEAHLVPFYNKNAGCKLVTLIPGYQGLMKLAMNGGEILDIQARCAFESDSFDHEYGTAPFLKHKPSLDADPGALRAAYAVARLRNGGTVFRVVTARDIRRVYNPKSKGWREDESAMWEKTAIRRLCKQLPKSTELARAIGLEDSAEAGSSDADLRSLVSDMTLTHPTRQPAGLPTKASTIEALALKMDPKRAPIDEPADPAEIVDPEPEPAVVREPGDDTAFEERF